MADNKHETENSSHFTAHTVDIGGLETQLDRLDQEQLSSFLSKYRLSEDASGHSQSATVGNLVHLPVITQSYGSALERFPRI